MSWRPSIPRIITERSDRTRGERRPAGRSGGLQEQLAGAAAIRAAIVQDHPSSRVGPGADVPHRLALTERQVPEVVAVGVEPGSAAPLDLVHLAERAAGP